MSRFTTSFNRRNLLRATATTAGLGAIASKSVLASPGSGADTRAAVNAQDVTTVNALMWSNGPTIDAHFDDRVQAFNEAHQDSIRVNLQYLPSNEYWQRLQLAYASGDVYDTYFWDATLYSHYDSGLLLNLQPMIDETGALDPAEYPIDLFEPWRYDGTNLYAMPENFQTVALYYNKELFDAEGIDYPDDTWTYDNLVEAALPLTKREGDRVIQWGMNLGILGVWYGMQSISWAKGTAFFDRLVEPTQFQLTQPENVETLDFLRSLVHDHEVAPSPSYSGQNSDLTAFASGRTGLVVDGSWSISGFAELPFEWGVAPLPMVEDNRVVPYWLGGWVIPKDSKAADAAFEWARWSSDEYQPQMAAERDWIPVLNSARESETMTEGMPEGYRAVIDALRDARIADVYSADAQRIWTEVFEPKITELLNQNRSAEEIAAEIDEGANAILNS